jgi:peptide/nickel transport system permease protein
MKISEIYSKHYIIVRLSNFILVFIAILIINFFIPRMMPGNFAQIYLAQLQESTAGLNINTKYLEQEINSMFGLNKPLFDQFLIYLRNVFSIHPNFGPSFEYYPEPAWNVVLQAAPWTLLLIGTSQLIAWSTGVFVGVYSAVHKSNVINRIFKPIYVFMLTIPPFWLGMIFIFVFAIELKVLPAGLAHSAHFTAYSVFLHLILPMSVVIIATFPSHVIVIRNSALEVLSSNYVMAMKAQGLSNGLFLKRVIKNSFLPSITQFFMSLGWLIGGIYVVEYTFSYPGMGTVIANAVFSLDYPVLQAALFLTTLGVLIANLCADFIYPLIDPRVSYASVR